MAITRVSDYLSVWRRRLLMKAGLLTRPERRVIFIHIQKTAGTSVVKMLSRHYADSYISHDKYLNKSDEEVGATRFVSGHFGYGYAKQFMAGRFSFTFLREPRERIISFYNFCRLQPPDLQKIYRVARDYNLDRFLELGIEDTLVRQCIYNHQVWQLAAGWSDLGGTQLDQYKPEEMLRDALENARHLSMLGVDADIDGGLRFILQQLKLPDAIKLPWENRGDGTSVNRDLPAQTHHRLDRLVELDESLYRTALDWWRARA